MFSAEQEMAILKMGTATAKIIREAHLVRYAEYDCQSYWDMVSLYVEQRPFYIRMSETFEPPFMYRKNSIIVEQITAMKHNYMIRYFKTWFPESDYGNYEQYEWWGSLAFVRSAYPTHGLFAYPCTELPYRLQWLHDLQWLNGDMLTAPHLSFISN